MRAPDQLRPGEPGVRIGRVRFRGRPGVHMGEGVHQIGGGPSTRPGPLWDYCSTVAR